MSYDLHGDVNSSNFNSIYCYCNNYISDVHLVVLLVSHCSALGYSVTELVCVDIFKLIHIPQ
jgi:hypothetical protein